MGKRPARQPARKSNTFAVEASGLKADDSHSVKPARQEPTTSVGPLATADAFESRGQNHFTCSVE